MKIKSLLFASLLFCTSLVPAVTLDLEVQNRCSGDFVVRVSCNQDYVWRGTPYAKSEFFTIPQMEPGETCSLFNLWDVLAFSYLFADHVTVEIPKEIDPDAFVKAVVVFENRSALNVCVPTTTRVVAE